MPHCTEQQAPDQACGLDGAGQKGMTKEDLP
jgi:hypothetical protein